MPVPDPLAAHLLEVVRALDPLTEQAMAVARGASFSQLAALRLLGTTSSTVTALATALGTHRSTASRLVDRLVAQGLASKASSSVSGREVVVQATLAGRAAARAVAELRLAAITELLAPLDDQERDTVESALILLLRLTPTASLLRSQASSRIG